MLVAETKDGKKVYAWDWGKGREKLICPHCKGETLFVDATLKIKHFRHKVECPYHTEPETEDHLAMKTYLYNRLKPLVDFVDVEVRFENNIADVYFEIGGHKYVFECQHSPISSEEVKTRNSSYNRQGCRVFWVFSTKNYLKPEWEGRVRLKEVELFIYKALGHVLYFFNEEGGKIGFRTFSTAYGYVEETEYGGGYSYPLKTIKKVNLEEDVYLDSFIREISGKIGVKTKAESLGEYM